MYFLPYSKFSSSAEIFRFSVSLQSGKEIDNFFAFELNLNYNLIPEISSSITISDGLRRLVQDNLFSISTPTSEIFRFREFTLLISLFSGQLESGKKFNYFSM